MTVNKNRSGIREEAERAASQGGGGGSLTATGTITAAQIIAGSSIELLAAPGAGFYLRVLSARLVLRHQAPNHDAQSVNMRYRGGGANLVVLNQIENAFDTISDFIGNQIVNGEALSAIENTAIDFNIDGIPTVGGGDVDWEIEYKTAPI